MTEANTTKALARIHLAAKRAGIEHLVADELWTVATLTPDGQHMALARWRQCMRTWPAA